MSTDHRKKACTSRNGRSTYEKGRKLYRNYGDKKLVKGYRGSVTHAPDEVKTTLSEVWPND